MSLARKAVKNGVWFAIFKSVSQVLSWGVTIVVARILSPADYALSAMATLITGYAEIFSEMGIGASIIQKKTQTQRDLSSIFWFALGVSCLFALACFPISYLTAHIFNEPRVIPLVQAVSVLFIFTGLQVVPLSLLKRDLDYKTIGIIEMQSTTISCLCMVGIAYFDGGVWTLIGGRIIRGGVRLVLVYRATKWKPDIYYNYAQAKDYLQFGIVVAFSSSVFYIFEMSDRFFAGRAWPLEVLGYYLLAMQLAKMPMDKIVSTINNVTYSLFSRYQDDREKFIEYYLKTIKLTSVLVFPIFVGGFVFAERIVPLLLGEKWIPMIALFKFLCLVQIITSLNAIVSYVHMALGYPSRGAVFYGACALLMSISFYFAVDYEKEMILIPWFTTYVILSVAWIVYTNIKLGIGGANYLRSIVWPSLASLAMFMLIYVIRSVDILVGFSSYFLIIVEVFIAVVTYLLVLWIFDKETLLSIKSWRKS